MPVDGSAQFPYATIRIPWLEYFCFLGRTRVGKASLAQAFVQLVLAKNANSTLQDSFACKRNTQQVYE